MFLHVSCLHQHVKVECITTVTAHIEGSDIACYEANYKKCYDLWSCVPSFCNKNGSATPNYNYSIPGMNIPASIYLALLPSSLQYPLFYRTLTYKSVYCDLLSLT